MPVRKFEEDDQIEFSASRHTWFSGIKLWVRARRGFDNFQRKSLLFPEAIVWTEIDRESSDAGLRHEPFMELTDNEAQILMDELWKFGIRPSDGSGNVGQIKAMDDHLKDMRHLVFKGNLPK